MLLQINYVVPTGEVIFAGTYDTEMIGYDAWLDSMVSPNQDVVFFYTVPTTDIGDLPGFDRPGIWVYNGLFCRPVNLSEEALLKYVDQEFWKNNIYFYQ